MKDLLFALLKMLVWLFLSAVILRFFMLGEP